MAAIRTVLVIFFEKETFVMAQEKPQASNKFIFILAAIGIICAIGGVIAANNKTTFTERLSEQQSPVASAEAKPAVTIDTTDNLDLAAASKERILGDKNAPIKISEHASFTCGHCANFHNNIFPEFKEKYIDTGIVYFVFSDFPLNAPALHATMISRCVADDKDYFDLVKTLFAEHEKWAFESNYVVHLKKYAKDAGVNETTFNNCLDNEKLRDNIVERIKAVQTLYQVNSTPSFVINNQKIITGATNFASFDAAFTGAIKELGLENVLSVQNAADSALETVVPEAAKAPKVGK